MKLTNDVSNYEQFVHVSLFVAYCMMNSKIELKDMDKSQLFCMYYIFVLSSLFHSHITWHIDFH
jgi:hypothetical protein